MTERIKPLIPAIILGLILIGLLVWYMMSTPAPVVLAPGSTATTTASVPAHESEESTYYTTNVSYPTETPLKASAGADADIAAVTAMKTFVQQEIGRFKDNGDFANLSHDDIQMQGLDQRKYALGIEYKMYQNTSTVSYVYQMYQDTGGAHPNTYYRTFTFDKKSGEALHLDDLFTGATYLQTLSTLSRAKLVPLIAQRTETTTAEVNVEYVESGTLPEADSFQSFYFEGDTFVLVFPPYQVGPYVLGMIELPIATSELKDLRSTYAK